jgi:hypothetical protein
MIAIERAAARWGVPKPSPDDVVSAYVDRIHPARDREWYQVWRRLLEAVADRSRKPRPANQGVPQYAHEKRGA